MHLCGRTYVSVTVYLALLMCKGFVDGWTPGTSDTEDFTIEVRVVCITNRADFKIASLYLCVTLQCDHYSKSLTDTVLFTQKLTLAIPR